MVTGEDRNGGSWITWATAVRWGNAGCRRGQQQSVVIHNSQVVHTVRTPRYISSEASLHPTPPLSPSSPATDRQEVPKCVLSRQQRSVKPSCTPMRGHSQTALGGAAQWGNSIISHPSELLVWQLTPPKGQRQRAAWVFPACSRNTLTPRVPFSPLSPCRP